MKRKTGSHSKRTRHRRSNRHLSDTYYYVGDHATTTRISFTCYNETVLETREVEAKDLSVNKLANAACINWFEVSGMSDSETITRMVEDCGLHNMNAKDILTPQHVTKIEEDNGHLFVVLNSSYYDEKQELHSEHISIVVAGNVVITFTETDNQVFAEVHQALKSNMLNLRKKGSGMLLAFLLNTVTANLSEAASKVEDILEDIEETLLDISNDTGNIGVMIQQRRRDYMTIRKNSQPLKERFLKLLRMENDIITPDLVPIYDDIYDQLQFAEQTVEGCREIISALVDLYISNNDLRMNAIMKRLTVVATVFIPLTFLVGLWGMNFTNMPELSWKYGYLFAWGVILGAGVITWLFLKKKDWY